MFQSKKSTQRVNFFSRDDWIRTSGLFVPNEARYRAALHPVPGGGKSKKLMQKKRGGAFHFFLHRPQHNPMQKALQHR
jgi:hypothetical protein